ncbi:CBS domain-containing protein [Mucilaginibacter antarcticus]
MRTETLPFVPLAASFTDVLLVMSEGKLGMVVVGNKDHVEGIITDGDLRRALLRNKDIAQLSVAGMMTANPIMIDGDEFVSQVEVLMMEKKITNVLVGKNRKLDGIYQIYTQ